MLELLLSGLAGALLATILNSAFELWRDRLRLRAETMLSVVAWSDRTYVRIIDMQLEKGSAYKDGKGWLTQEEYNLNSRELRRALISAELSARVALVFGEGEELALLNRLRNELLQVTRQIWAARKETWSEASGAIDRRFTEVIEPLRRQFEKRLLRSASLPILLHEFKERAVEGPGWQPSDVEREPPR